MATPVSGVVDAGIEIGIEDIDDQVNEDEERRDHEDDSLQPNECAKLAAQYAARGVEMLASAAAAGLFQDPETLETLKTDVYLDVLRSRRDFQKLLAEVEEKAKGQSGQRDPKPAPRS